MTKRGRARKRESKSKTPSSLQRWWRDNAIVGYLRDTRTELRRVHWPSQEEAWNLTKLVLGVTVAMAVFMGLLDYLFSLELQGLIARDSIAIGIAFVAAVASVVVTIIFKRQTA